MAPQAWGMRIYWQCSLGHNFKVSQSSISSMEQARWVALAFISADSTVYNKWSIHHHHPPSHWEALYAGRSWHIIFIIGPSGVIITNITHWFNEEAWQWQPYVSAMCMFCTVFLKSTQEHKIHTIHATKVLNQPLPQLPYCVCGGVDASLTTEWFSLSG